MEYIQTFSLHEQKCMKKTAKSLKSTLRLNEEILNFYFNLILKQSNDDTDIPLQDFSIMIIHSKILKISTCLSTLLLKGNYCEFQSLQRDVFELHYLSEYLIKNPEKVDPWFEGESIKHSHVSKNLEIPLAMKQLYGMMCDYTHPNFNGIKGNLLLEHDDIVNFNTYPEFHKPTARALVVMQNVLLYSAMDLFFKQFKKFNNFNLEDEKQLKQIRSRLGKSSKAWIKYSYNPENEIFPMKVQM
ncbi:hypothetical protein [Methanoregula sp. UBA64]|uniref:hypothetical protein n=1 Tax=Methanoregula sp. UBA64 TaxID=1915554 RepID=UPI0025D194E6|nr:hypothetical protein [Methanoregula sp. UBA64]